MSNQRFVAGVVVACALTGCSIDVHGQGATVTEEKRFNVRDNPRVSLRTFDGSIEVRSWDRNEVQVQIDRRAATSEEARALEVRATQEGDRIVIEAPELRNRRESIGIGVNQSPSVAFIVRVPRALTLEARTGDGAIVASELAGTIDLRTGDGSIRADRLQGRVTANTGDGSITVRDGDGEFDVDTGDGSVELSGRLQALRINTGDGSVSLDVASGSVMKTDWSVTTGDGSISANLPVNFDAEVEARSGDGRVRASWASSERRRNDDDDDENQSFSGRLGKGGRMLRFQSGDGSISLNRR